MKLLLVTLILLLPSCDECNIHISGGIKAPTEIIEQPDIKIRVQDLKEGDSAYIAAMTGDWGSLNIDLQSNLYFSIYSVTYSKPVWENGIHMSHYFYLTKKNRSVDIIYYYTNKPYKWKKRKITSSNYKIEVSKFELKKLYED